MSGASDKLRHPSGWIRFVWFGCVGFWFFGSNACKADGNQEQSKHRRLVEGIRHQGVSDPCVLNAITEVKRHLFVPQNLQANAYGDYPLPIGFGQTISQPFIVAYMTQQLALRGSERVLEIGTGSGYQTAVLAQCAKKVYSIEIISPLSKRAARLLDQLGIANVQLKVGDGHQGWAEQAPFEAIIVTAAPTAVPNALIRQLQEGGRMVIPVGPAGNQILYSYIKKEGQLVEVARLPVRFVPMTHAR